MTEPPQGQTGPAGVYPDGMVEVRPLELTFASVDPQPGGLRPSTGAGSPPTTQRLVSNLMHAYPRQQVTDSNHGAYVAALSDLPPDVLAAAVERCIRTEEWLPTVAVVRRTAAEIMLDLPTEAEALSQIQARQEWGRHTYEDGDVAPPVHRLVETVLARVGGWYAFRSAENAEVIRGQFGRIYRDARADAIRRAQSGM